MRLITSWSEAQVESWRLVGTACSANWTPAFREKFLLRSDASPISADRYISPEVPRDTPGAIVIRLLVPTVSDLVLSAEETEAFPPDGWCLLGYDVCDESMLSGLMDCAYFPEEAERLGRLWSSRLNRWHLIEKEHDAEEFRVLTDTRVPEHAPFHVVALLTRDVPAEGK